MCGSCGGNKQAERAAAVSTREGVANDCCQPKQSQQQNPCTDELKSLQQQPYIERVPCIGNYEQHLFETLDEDTCDKGPKEPYHIPGYAGHVPTIQSRAGHTFGQDTHDVLSSTPGPSTASYGKQGSHICPEPMHEPYRIPGYTGHVPGLKSIVGGTFGSDTHKVLYSVENYPNRQENLSTYRPGQENHNGNGRSADQYLGAQTNGQSYGQASQAKPPHGGTSTSSTYQTSQEHYYQPQYKYRIADTYATRADLTLVDPCVNEESKVVVSTRELDDTQVVRTQDCLEERVQDLPYINKPIRHRPMVPGFDTFIDALRGARGQRFEFTPSSSSHLKLQQQLVLHKGKVRQFPRSGGSSVGRNGTKSPEPSKGGREDDPPYGYSKYGEHQRYTNSALYDFTSNYRRRMSSEWAPAGISRPDPPAFDIPGEIYNEHIGLLPGYSAHIPGAMFRCGKTFTDDSRDAKRALRGDRF